MRTLNLATQLHSLCSCSVQSVLILVVSISIGYIFLVLKPQRRRDRPPGPFSLPLIGNLHQLGKKPWEKCLQWKKKYGPIIKVNFLTFETIVLTDAKLIREAFALQALAGRPRIKLFEEPGRGRGLGQSDGPFAAEQRQFAIKQLKTLVHQSQLMDEKIQEEVGLVVQSILNRHGIEKACAGGSPIQMHRLFDIPSLNVVWNLFMGYRFEHDDARVKRIICVLSEASNFDGILEALSFFVPTLVDLFPNATGGSRRIKDFNEIYAMFEQEFKDLPSSYSPGQPTNYKEAFADQVSLNKDNQNSSFYPPRNEFPIVIGDILAGSSETTGTSLSWFVLYMAHNPEIQKKLHLEVQSVTGGNPPSLTDRPKTPYAEAVVNELIRILPAIPLGIFHRTMEDINLFGYPIKKDTVFISNLWGVNNDPEIWDEPEKFKPERFLQLEMETRSGIGTGEETETDSFSYFSQNYRNYRIKPEKVRQVLSFSSGKRSCPGENIARDTLYLFATTLVQHFEMTFDPFKNPPLLEGTAGFVYRPKPFEITFKKRL